MKLAGVASALPSRYVTNDEIVSIVEEHSAGLLGDRVEAVAGMIRSLLDRSGAVGRRWLATDESPMPLVRRAVADALSQAGLAAGDIDLLVYVGVDRVLVEPANAYIFADALDMPAVECFDILDACNAWVRACEVVDGLFARGRCRTALILSAEFGASPRGPGFPGHFTFGDAESLRWKFAGLTLGEAATATVLTSDGGRWEFQVTSHPGFVDLCSVAVTDPGRYGLENRLGLAGGLLLTSFNEDLFAVAESRIRELYERCRAPLDEVSAVFVHAAAATPWDPLAAELGIKRLLHNVYPHLGNVVTSSIPAAIAEALASGAVEPGALVQALVGSAGMSFSLATFRL